MTSRQGYNTGGLYPSFPSMSQGPVSLGGYPSTPLYPAMSQWRSSPSDTTASVTAERHRYPGTLSLVSINMVMHAIISLIGWKRLAYYLVLVKARPRVTALVTSLFCHENWQHLSANVFMLYLFGRIIEDAKGSRMVVAQYLVCGVFANLVVIAPYATGLLTDNHTYLVGASGAVFGLYVSTTLVKLQAVYHRLVPTSSSSSSSSHHGTWSLTGLLYDGVEVVILGQFVLVQLWKEMSEVGSSDNVSHFAHLAGSVAGVGILALSSSGRVTPIAHPRVA